MLVRAARLALLSLIVALLFPLPAARAQAPAAPGFNLQAHYTKHEFYIPMRDGKRLFTSIYVPKDDSKSYPFLMVRTPYSVAPYGVDHYRPFLGPSPMFER